MRIAYLLADPGIPVLGGKGGSVHVQQLVRALTELGHTVDLFCANAGSGTDALPARILEIAPHTISTAVEPGTDARLAKELKWIERAGALERAVVEAHRSRPYDVIYERQALWSRAGVRAAAKCGIPTILEVNAPLRLEAQQYRQLAAETVVTDIEVEVFRSADAMLAVSDGVRQYIVSRGGDPMAVRVVPNGVDAAAFHPDIAPADVPELDEHPVIGFAGGLKHWHGIQELAEAFRLVKQSVPDAKLLVVGDGPKREWLEGFLRGADLRDDAVITGWVSHEDIPALVRRMDVATAPYPELEDFYFSPLKLFEYIAAGRPVVASAIGQIGEVITHDDNGLLVRPGSVPQLADAICRLLSDHDLRARVGRRARESAASYSWRANAELVTSLASTLRSRGLGRLLFQGAAS